MLDWASCWRQLGGNFRTDLVTLPQSGVVRRWPSAGDTAGYAYGELTHRIYGHDTVAILWVQLGIVSGANW